MKNVTVTFDETVLARARIEAARQGKSLSRFVSESVERRVGRPASQRDAFETILNLPLSELTDEAGQAPSRNDLYG
jgi:hypothetical protein